MMQVCHNEVIQYYLQIKLAEIMIRNEIKGSFMRFPIDAPRTKRSSKEMVIKEEKLKLNICFFIVTSFFINKKSQVSNK